MQRHKENKSLGFPASLLGGQRCMLLLLNEDAVPPAAMLVLAARREGAWHATLQHRGNLSILCLCSVEDT